MFTETKISSHVRYQKAHLLAVSSKDKAKFKCSRAKENLCVITNLFVCYHQGLYFKKSVEKTSLVHFFYADAPEQKSQHHFVVHVETQSISISV